MNRSPVVGNEKIIDRKVCSNAVIFSWHDPENVPGSAAVQCSADTGRNDDYEKSCMHGFSLFN